MNAINRFPAFARGCVTAIVLGLASGATAQSGDDTILVCVAKDGVLRLASGKCPAGQDSFVLKRAELDEPQAPKPTKDSKPPPKQPKKPTKRPPTT